MRLLKTCQVFCPPTFPSSLVRCHPGKSCADLSTSAVFGVWRFRLGGNNGAAEGAAAEERWPGLSCEMPAGSQTNKQCL